MPGQLEAGFSRPATTLFGAQHVYGIQLRSRASGNQARRGGDREKQCRRCEKGRTIDRIDPVQQAGGKSRDAHGHEHTYRSTDERDTENRQPTHGVVDCAPRPGDRQAAM